MIVDPSSFKFWLTTIVIAYLTWEIYCLWLAKLSENWPASTCIIVEASIDEKDDDGITYFARVRYSYKIGIKTHESTRFSYQSLSWVTLGEASEFLRGISKGKVVPVFYDPKVPSRSVLLRGYNSQNVIGIIIVCVILALIYNTP